jgi:hypothetical protein
MIQRLGTNPLLRAAVAYARCGLRVFPVYEVNADGRCACGKECGRDAGKHPRTSHGFKDATCDEATIRTWWTRWPNANIGIRTGDGLVVIDIDVHDA